MTGARYTNLPRTRRILLRVAAAVALLMPSTAMAGGNIANLGKPTATLSPYLPLGSFRHTGPILRDHGKLEVLFISTMAEPDSSAQRWPLVKALDQFGTWSGLRPSASLSCSTSYNFAKVTCRPAAIARPGVSAYLETISAPTYDLSAARYASRYVTLDDRDLVDLKGRVVAGLSHTELSYFRKYVALNGYPTYEQMIWRTVFSPAAQPGRLFPLIAVDGYVETGANVSVAADIAWNPTAEYRAAHFPTTPAPSFSEIQQSLQRGRDVSSLISPSLVSDVNAEANLIAAFICYGDGRRPSSVCNRPAIKHNLKYIK